MKLKVKYIRIALYLLIVVIPVTCIKASRNELRLRNTVGAIGGGETFVEIVSEGDWTLEMEYPGSQKNWAVLMKKKGSGSTNSVILSYSENEELDSREAIVKAHFTDETKSVSFVQKGLSSSLEGGEGTVLPSWEDYPSLRSDVVRGWMELPAVSEQEGCAWVFHDMHITQPYYSDRNYSVFYDAANLMPRWVAYPLNSSLCGDGKRSDKWEENPDPKIPQQYQPYTDSSWGVSGYDRGHMVPSADRVVNPQANWQTFYPTNIAVQNSQFNQNLWGNLESMVRAWSGECDTLYVVTGVVPSESRFIVDRGGNRVNVPEGFYKALLKGNVEKDDKGNPSGMKYTSAIAFYFKNESQPSSKVSASMAMSVAALESKVQMNFFINLPAQYQNIEKVCSPSDWGLK